MADDKKSKGSEAGGGGSTGEAIVFWLMFGLVIIFLINYFASKANITLNNFPHLSDIFYTIFNTFQVFSVFLSLVFLLGIIYFNFRTSEIMHEGHGHGEGHHSHGHAHPSSSHVEHHEIHKSEPNPRWQSVLSKIQSQNEGDWRVAIIEADIILNEMLDRMGYNGEGVADKLKQVIPGDFKTLQSAWEAHKVRNEIAHGGVGFHLTHHQAKRTINLFEEVFQEFYFI